MGIFLSKIRSLWETKKKTKLILIGLDSAGKTTLLYKLKLNENVYTIPTIGFNVEEVAYKNMSMTMWDIGGQTKIRQLWSHYYDNLDGVIFMIDSNDFSRMGEVKRELLYLTAEEKLRGVPILFYSNKQDLPKAMSVTDIRTKAQLYTITDRNWYIQGCSALSGAGVYEGMDWLYNEIKNKK